jgi:hypothetical protein
LARVQKASMKGVGPRLDGGSIHKSFRVQGV